MPKLRLNLRQNCIDVTCIYLYTNCCYRYNYIVYYHLSHVIACHCYHCHTVTVYAMYIYIYIYYRYIHVYTNTVYIHIFIHTHIIVCTLYIYIYTSIFNSSSQLQVFPSACVHIFLTCGSKPMSSILSACVVFRPLDGWNDTDTDMFEGYTWGISFQQLHQTLGHGFVKVGGW